MIQLVIWALVVAWFAIGLPMLAAKWQRDAEADE